MAAEIKLKHALAYKGRGLELYRSATDLVREAITLGTGLFLINEFPSVRKPEVKKIFTKSESVFDGELNLHEAMGLVAVATEAEELYKMYNDGSRQLDLNRIMKLEDVGLVSVALGAFTMFGERFEGVSGVRKFVRDNVQQDASKFSYEEKEETIQVYARSLVKDKFVIGKKTTEIMIYDALCLSKIGKRDLPAFHWGANAARDLYLEVYNAAAKEFTL